MMKLNRAFLLATLLLTSGLLLISCGDDDPTALPGDEEVADGNTSAPQILYFTPSQGQVDVGVDKSVDIYFSEPMDTVDAVSRVTLSAGIISNVVWEEDNRTLVLYHTDWSEDDEVTVTVSDDLRDMAGNKMAAGVTFSFLTRATTLQLLDFYPGDDAVDVPTNTYLSLRFNKYITSANIGKYVSITGPDDVDYNFGTGDYMDDGTWMLYLWDDLPANTPVTVTVDGDIAASPGFALGTDHVFSFTTGAVADTTAPVLLSMDPPSGSTISAWDNVLVLTFSEQMDEDFGFTVLDVLSLYGLESAGTTSWNEDYTVLTLSFGGSFPAGVELTVGLGRLSDLYGNYCEDNPLWNVTVMGTPDHFPVADGFGQEFSVHAVSGDDESWSSRIRYMDFENDSDFRWYTANADDWDFNSWDYMTKASDGIMLRGFHEYDGEDGFDVMFDAPARYLDHPLTTSDWNGILTADMGEDTVTINYSVTVLEGVEDLPWRGYVKSSRLDKSIAADNPDFLWPNCRRVVLTHETSVGGELMDAGADTSWYCPGVGQVKFSNYYTEDGVEEWEEGSLVEFYTELE